MKVRVDAGTGVAMIGAWDARRGVVPLAGKMPPNLAALLEDEVASGDLYFVRSGKAGGGPVDIYVDQPIAEEMLAALTALPGEHLLHIPSGELAVGGVENYRAPFPTRLADKVTVPPGDYGVRCYVPSGAATAPDLTGELERRVGASALRGYDRANFLAVMGGFTIPAVTFAAVTWLQGWKVAAALAVLTALAYPPLMQWALRSSATYVRLHEVISDFRRRHQAPCLVLALRTAHPGHGLCGGSAVLP